MAPLNTIEISEEKLVQSQWTYFPLISVGLSQSSLIFFNPTHGTQPTKNVNIPFASTGDTETLNFLTEVH